MAASAWVFYNEFLKWCMDGTVDIDGDTFKLGLYLSGSNALTQTLSTQASITSELASSVDYPGGGLTLSAVTWASGAHASEMRFDCTAKIFSSSSVDFSDIRFAVIFDRTTGTSDGDSKPVMAAQLSTAGFDITTGNTLTITPSANGLFELNTA